MRWAAIKDRRQLSPVLRFPLSNCPMRFLSCMVIRRFLPRFWPAPLLWRTMANGNHATWPPQLRYTSEADAIIGHDAFAAAMALVSEANVTAGLADPGVYLG